MDLQVLLAIQNSRRLLFFCLGGEEHRCRTIERECERGCDLQVEAQGYMFMCTDKYNTHINFKEFCDLIGLDMRLRHKKPLNPYKGQTNNDKSEFNDDDFNQQGSPIKRNAPGANDQVFKYARILTKFIKIANQNYRLFAANADLPPTGPTHHDRQDLPLNDSENQRENKPFKSQQINQLKQKLKIQSKKQVKQSKRESKYQTKKKDQTHFQFINQENKQKPVQNSSANSIDPSKVNNYPRSSIQNLDRNEKNLNFSKSIPPNATSAGLNTFPTPNGSSIFQNIKADASISATLNPNNIPNNLQAYLNYANFFGQNQLLPGMYAGMQGLPMQMNQLPMGLMQLGLNMKLLGMGMNNPLLAQAQQGKPYLNLFNQQAKIYSISKDKQNSDKTASSKEVYPLKRAAFHVAIAYKIYLDKLKKKGVSFQNLEEIDPTRNARRIKSGQTIYKGKDNSKKKK